MNFTHHFHVFVLSFFLTGAHSCKKEDIADTFKGNYKGTADITRYQYEPSYAETKESFSDIVVNIGYQNKTTLKNVHIYLPSPYGIYGAYKIELTSPNEINYTTTESDGGYKKIKGTLSSNSLTIYFEGGNERTGQKSYFINANVERQ